MLCREDKSRRRRARAGFTLIELMVVVVIIGLLATIVTTNVMRSLEDANITAAKANIKGLQTAITAYKLKMKKYPPADAGLNALITNEKNQNFLSESKVPDDPWGNPYVYRSPGPDNQPYAIISYGADGVEGGTGIDADILSYDLQGSGG